MSTKKAHIDKNKIYYCTVTCFKWLNLFEITQLYENIYSWFDYMKERYNNQIIGYIIMPNHLHLIIYVSNKSKTINQLIGDGKRFMAYEIVTRLENQNEANLLNILKSGVDKSEAIKGKKHQVFESSFDCKVCLNNDFIEQKFKYIHQNPVKGKWNLVENYIDY